MGIGIDRDEIFAVQLRMRAADMLAHLHGYTSSAPAATPTASTQATYNLMAARHRAPVRTLSLFVELGVFLACAPHRQHSHPYYRSEHSQPMPI
jgi:hypothetical protein